MKTDGVFRSLLLLCRLQSKSRMKVKCESYFDMDFQFININDSMRIASLYCRGFDTRKSCKRVTYKRDRFGKNSNVIPSKRYSIECKCFSRTNVQTFRRKNILSSTKSFSKFDVKRAEWNYL